jgi:hypothetical protein
MNQDFDQFKSYCALANRLLDAMDKEQVAECLRVMAVHLAEYQRRFGEIPRQDLLELAGATEINDEQARMLRDGMEVLVGYLASAREGWEEDDGPLH